VRALHGQDEDLPVLSRARPVLAAATVGVKLEVELGGLKLRVSKAEYRLALVVCNIVVCMQSKTERHFTT
jgi:hypothetical protein